MKVGMGGLIPFRQGRKSPVNLIQFPPGFRIHTRKRLMGKGIGVSCPYILPGLIGKHAEAGGHLNPLPEPEPFPILLKPECVGDIAFPPSRQPNLGQFQGVGPGPLFKEGHGLVQKDISLETEGVDTPQIVRVLNAFFPGQVGLNLGSQIDIAIRVVLSEFMEKGTGFLGVFFLFFLEAFQSFGARICPQIVDKLHGHKIRGHKICLIHRMGIVHLVLVPVLPPPAVQTHQFIKIIQQKGKAFFRLQAKFRIDLCRMSQKLKYKPVFTVLLQDIFNLTGDRFFIADVLIGHGKVQVILG